jgi:hypothetical protein
MTACRDIRELASTALDGALSPPDQARLDAHLAGCEACRTFQRELEAAHRLVRGVEAVEPPPWLASKIMARVRAEAAPRASFWRRAILPILLKPQYQVATLLLVCATSYYLVRNRPEAELQDAAPGRPEVQAAPLRKATGAEDKTPAATPAEGGIRPEAPKPMEQEGRRAVPGDREKQGELDGLASGLDDSKQKKDHSGFAPAAEAAPPAAPAPAPAAQPTESKLYGYVAPKPSAANAAAGGAATPPGRDERTDLARASKKVADTAPEKARAKEEALQEAAPAPPLLIQWEPDDLAQARQLLERELADLGGTIAPDRGQRQARALSARLDGRRVPELVARLSRLGTVRPAQAQQQQVLRAGPVNLLIRW